MAAPFIIIKRCKRPKCPSVDGWIKRLWHVYIVQYYLAVNGGDVPIHCTTWVNLEDVTLSERRPTPKATDRVIPFM